MCRLRVHVCPESRIRKAGTALLGALLVLAMLPVAPAEASSATWTVDTLGRTESDIRRVWQQLRPSYDGAVHTVSPLVTTPYAPGETTAGFVADGLGIINFARYLAGLPADVVTTPEMNLQAQHGAVLLAASTFSHTPPKPADMSQAFYDIAVRSTSYSNIGAGYRDAESFQMACLHDSSASNLTRIGHRRWLLNPRMKQTGIGYAETRLTTWAIDNSRSETVSFDTITWPAAGLFPVEFMTTRTPWSVTLDPGRYEWDTAGHRVTLTRVADGRSWSFDATTKDTAGTYFNADFSYIGVRNAFIFRPDPATITYAPGDEFDVRLEGGIRLKGTSTPAIITYRTKFMTLDGPVDAEDEGTTDPGDDVTVPGDGNDAALPDDGDEAVGELAVTQVAGTDRIATAIAASKKAFPGGAPTVVIATATNWPDALGGAALAGSAGGPILLTTQASLPSAVVTEIKRLGAKQAIVLGGTGAVSSSVESQLRTALGAGGSVTRIAGSDRYDTARRIAAETVKLRSADGGYDGVAFLATGANFPDALGASPLAAGNGWPIYLSGGGLDAATASAMKRAGVTKVIVLGGTGVVSTAVEQAVVREVGCSVQRIAGTDRYQTAVKVAAYGVNSAGMSWDGVAIATGTGFPDALAGGVLQGTGGSVVLLTPPTKLDTSVRGTLSANRDSVTEVRFLGGTGAVSTTVRTEVTDALR